MKKSGIIKRDVNEIVVYQPDGVKRIDVALMVRPFGCFRRR